MISLKSHITILTIFLSCSLSLSSCDNESQVPDVQPSTESNTSNVKIKDVNQAVIDSINNFKSQIEAISKESKEAIDEVSTIKATVSHLQNKEIWLWSAIGFVCVVVLILFSYFYKLYANLQGKVKNQSSDIQKLQGERQANSFPPRTVEKPSIPADNDSINRRLSELEKQLKRLSDSLSRQQQSPTITTDPVIEHAPTKIGYFGNPIPAAEPYFKKLLVPSDSEARFSVEISGDKAIFKPLDSSSYLGTFISYDAMRAAIDFSGCPTNKASSMQVKNPGEAKQRDNKWFITKKAEVHLS